MIGTNWFQMKWGIDKLPMDDIYDRIVELELQVKELQEKYQGALDDIRRLEEENVGTINELYRLENSLDARIDILAEHMRIDYDV